MTHSTTSGTSGPSKAQREADARAARRAEQASIVAGLQSALDPHEQLLGFARGRIAGGFRGKLNIGPEAFFAPFVNIGLTERRFVLQHIRRENGKPADILPHFFSLAEIASLTFSDIETYGGEPACRLILKLNNELFCRLRLRGALNFENAQSLTEVFASLTASYRSVTTPTQRTCPQCTQTLDQPYRFCPYCGAAQPEPPAAQDAADASEAVADAAAEGAVGETVDSPFDFVAPTPPVDEVEPTSETETEPPSIWPTGPLEPEETEAAVESRREEGEPEGIAAEHDAPPTAAADESAIDAPGDVLEPVETPVSATPDEQAPAPHDASDRGEDSDDDSDRPY